jgi:drug/metabolite transporter (DMT)-like permease
MIFFFASIAIVGSAGLTLFDRYILKRVSAHAFSLLTQILGALLFLPIALTNLHYMNTREAWFAIAIASILWAAYSLIGSISIKKTEASIRAPLSQSKLLWAVLFGAVILKEVVTWQHMVAVFIIFIGVSVLLWHPEKRFGSLKDPGIRWTLLTAILSALVAIADKYALGFFPVELYGFLVYLFPGFILLAFTPNQGKDINYLLKTNKLNLLLSAALGVVCYYATLKVYVLLEISVAYPLLPLSTLLVVFGGILFFKEKGNAWQKIAAAIIVIAGSVWLKLG